MTVIKNSLLKVVILGDGGVGKTCLMNRFVLNTYDDYSFHTIGVEFMTKEMAINGENYTLQIWDTAGQERFKSLRTPFYRGSDICLLTYAVDDRCSFSSLPQWQKEFIHYADIRDKSSFPFIVVANKVDCIAREVSEYEARGWCKQNGDIPYIETSAKDALNIEEAFETAVSLWIEREESLHSDIMSFAKPISLNSTSMKNKSYCC